MDTIFYWTGATIWACVAVMFVLLVLLGLSRILLATLSVAAQMVRAWRRGQPRSEYYSPVGAIWTQEFFRGTWSGMFYYVKRACGPVTPWVKGEHLRRGYTVMDSDD